LIYDFFFFYIIKRKGEVFGELKNFNEILKSTPLDISA
jgi:hypothetical protein